MINCEARTIVKTNAVEFRMNNGVTLACIDETFDEDE